MTTTVYLLAPMCSRHLWKLRQVNLRLLAWRYVFALCDLVQCYSHRFQTSLDLFCPFKGINFETRFVRQFKSQNFVSCHLANAANGSALSQSQV